MSLHVFDGNIKDSPLFGISTADYKPLPTSILVEKPEDLPDEFPFRFKDTNCGTLAWMKDSELNKEVIFHSLGCYFCELPHDKYWLTFFMENIKRHNTTELLKR